MHSYSPTQHTTGQCSVPKTLHIFVANLLTGAFSTNHLDDTNKTKHNYNKQHRNLNNTKKLLTCIWSTPRKRKNSIAKGGTP